MDQVKVLRKREKNFYPTPKLCVRYQDERRIIDYLGWRRDMALWLLDTARIFEIHSSTAESAMLVLDRLASVDNDITEDFELYQLACFGSLLVACKIIESKQKIKKSKILDLIRECCHQEELDHMELHILYSLHWLVQPPTTIDIARELLELVPQEIIPDRSRIEENVSASLKLGIVESRFLPFKASSIALASVLCALRPILHSQYFEEIEQFFLDILEYNDECHQELEQLQTMIISASEQDIEYSDSDSMSIDYAHWLHSTPTHLQKAKSSCLENPEASPRSVLSEN